MTLPLACSGEFRDEVLVGAWKRNATAVTSAQWRKILGRVVIHPQYNSATDRNDYMLFQIEPVTDPALTPIELSTTNPGMGDQFTVVGMGFNSKRGTHSDRLLKVRVSYVEHGACQGQWMTHNRRVYEASMFCAIGDPTATKGPTQGSYMGPHFIQSTTNMPSTRLSFFNR
jgi:Trypsin